ncbi:MAG: leucyl/phenylalanyl-tRNA--protein transferase [Bdellovibrionota bacterium]
MSVEDEQNELLKEIFSDPSRETIEGVIAVGGKLDPELLIYAYDHGVFPWPHEGYPLLWFCPDQRGVIDFNELHLPKSFKKWINKNRSQFTITINQNFHEVLKNCKTQKRLGQNGTWITNEIEENYTQLYKMGHAFSLEVWRGDVLVGGIYGVQSEKYFSCESMFHKEDNVSKLALYELIVNLKSIGHTWMDIQMVTSVCNSFGGKLINKAEFLKRIGL